MTKSQSESDDQIGIGAVPNIANAEDVSEELRAAIRRALPPGMLQTDDADRIIDAVAEALSAGLVSVVHQVEHKKKTKFSGPLPPPDLLGDYEKVIPGLSERIVKMAEVQLTMANQ